MSATLMNVLVGLLVLVVIGVCIEVAGRAGQDRHEFLTNHCERIGETGRGAAVYRCDGGTP